MTYVVETAFAHATNPLSTMTHVIPCPPSTIHIDIFAFGVIVEDHVAAARPSRVGFRSPVNVNLVEVEVSQDHLKESKKGNQKIFHGTRHHELQCIEDLAAARVFVREEVSIEGGVAGPNKAKESTG